jgi:hypothetical protein
MKGHQANGGETFARVLLLALMMLTAWGTLVTAGPQEEEPAETVT